MTIVNITPTITNAGRAADAITDVLLVLEKSRQQFHDNAVFCAIPDTMPTMVNHWTRSRDTVSRMIRQLEQERREVEAAAPITIVIDRRTHMVDGRERYVVPQTHAGVQCSIVHEGAGARHFNDVHGPK